MTLNDGSDNYCYYFHEKEWYEWIFINEIQPLPSMIEAVFHIDETEYYKIFTEDDAKNFLTSNLNSKYKTFENDKALKIRFISKEAPDNKKDLSKWLSENNFEIEEEYDGYFY